MKASQRREKITEMLSQARQPLSASQLASQLAVSRQVIVGDIALLRASNLDILSTPRGYVLPQTSSSHQFIGKLACLHDAQDTEPELLTIIEHGGQVLDVQVEHPIYGMLTAVLNLKTQEDVSNFLLKMAQSNAGLLSDLTQGIHLHTIATPSKEDFEAIRQALSDQGFLLQEG